MDTTSVDEVSAESSRSSELASQIIGLLNESRDQETVILQTVPLLDDTKAIVDIRIEAVSRKTWRVECACDAALISTVNAETGGIGVKKELKEKAKDAHSDVSTIYRNAQIYTTFLGKKTPKRSLNVQTVLNEKGFYEAALRTEDPHRTIRILAHEKSNNPTYSVRDALKQVRDLNRNESPIPELGGDADYLDPHYRLFLAEVETNVLSFRNRCPRQEFKVRIDSWLRQTRYEKARTPENDYKAVRDQVDQGACTPEEIAEDVCLSTHEIRDFCTLIVEKEPETYEWRPIGVNTDMARGSRPAGIFRKDAPSGDDFVAHRDSRVEYEEEEGHY